MKNISKQGIDGTALHNDANFEFTKSPFITDPTSLYRIYLEHPDTGEKYYSEIGLTSPNAIHIDMDNQFDLLPIQSGIELDWYIGQDSTGKMFRTHLMDTLPDVFHKSIPNEFESPITYKEVLDTTDRILVESQNDSGEKVYTQASGIDVDAIHRSGEDQLTSIPIKTTPAPSDWFVIQDNVTGLIKRVNLVGDGTDNFHKSMSNEFSSPLVPYKETVDITDRILLESQSDLGEKRYAHSDGIDASAFHYNRSHEFNWNLPFVSSDDITNEDIIVFERSQFDWIKSKTNIGELRTKIGSVSGENLDDIHNGLYFDTTIINQKDTVLRFKTIDSIAVDGFQALSIQENAEWFNILLDSSKIAIAQIVETEYRNFVSQSDIDNWNTGLIDISDLQAWKIIAQSNIDKNSSDILSLTYSIDKNSDDISSLEENSVQFLETFGDSGSQYIISKEGNTLTQRRLLSNNNILGIDITSAGALSLTINQSNINGIGIQHQILEMGDNPIHGLTMENTPSPTDAANVSYVDSKAFAGNDSDAFHKSIPAEIIYLPHKEILEDDDRFLLEDSDSTLTPNFPKAEVTWADIKASLGQLTDTDAIHKTISGEFNLIPTSDNPDDGTKILCETPGGSKVKVLFSTFNANNSFDSDAYHWNQPNEFIKNEPVTDEIPLEFSDIIPIEKWIQDEGTGNREKYRATIQDIINIFSQAGVDTSAFHYNAYDEFAKSEQKFEIAASDRIILENSESITPFRKQFMIASDIRLPNIDNTGLHGNIPYEWTSIYGFTIETSPLDTSYLLLQDPTDGTLKTTTIADLTVTGYGGIDTTGYHYDIPYEWSTYNLPIDDTPDGNDYILLQDQGDGTNKISTLNNLPMSGAGPGIDTSSFHYNIANEWTTIYDLTIDDTPDGEDYIQLQDKTDGTKKISKLNNLPGSGSGPGVDTDAIHRTGTDEIVNLPELTSSDAPRDGYLALEVRRTINNPAPEPDTYIWEKRRIHASSVGTMGGSQSCSNRGTGTGEVWIDEGDTRPDDIKFRKLRSLVDYLTIENSGHHINFDIFPSKFPQTNADDLQYDAGLLPNNWFSAHHFSGFNYVQLLACAGACGLSLLGVATLSLKEVSDTANEAIDKAEDAIEAINEIKDLIPDNLESDVQSLKAKSHTQGTDTTLGTMTSGIDMGGHAIRNVGESDSLTSVATRGWVTENYESIGINSCIPIGIENYSSIYSGMIVSEDIYDHYFSPLYSASESIIITRIGTNIDKRYLNFEFDSTKIYQLGQQTGDLNMGGFTINQVEMNEVPQDNQVANVKFVKDEVNKLEIVNIGEGIDLMVIT